MSDLLSTDEFKKHINDLDQSAYKAAKDAWSKALDAEKLYAGKKFLENLIPYIAALDKTLTTLDTLRSKAQGLKDKDKRGKALAKIDELKSCATKVRSRMKLNEDTIVDDHVKDFESIESDKKYRGDRDKLDEFFADAQKMLDAKDGWTSTVVNDLTSRLPAAGNLLSTCEDSLKLKVKKWKDKHEGLPKAPPSALKSAIDKAKKYLDVEEDRLQDLSIEMPLMARKIADRKSRISLDHKRSMEYAKILDRRAGKVYDESLEVLKEYRQRQADYAKRLADFDAKLPAKLPANIVQKFRRERLTEYLDTASRMITQISGDRGGPAIELGNVEKELDAILTDAASLIGHGDDVDRLVGSIRANCMAARQSVEAAKQVRGQTMLVLKALAARAQERVTSYTAQRDALDAAIAARA